ncbi:MAG: type II secretion system protein GspE, partial [Thiohalomonadales bacterium]
DKENPPELHKAEGCSKCSYQGYRGRLGIYELIEIDDKLREMIHDGASEHAMEAYARETSRSIRQDGIRLVISGKTSIDEVIRVSKED